MLKRTCIAIAEVAVIWRNDSQNVKHCCTGTSIAKLSSAFRYTLRLLP